MSQPSPFAMSLSLQAAAEAKERRKQMTRVEEGHVKKKKAVEEVEEEEEGLPVELLEQAIAEEEEM